MIDRMTLILDGQVDRNRELRWLALTSEKTGRPWPGFERLYLVGNGLPRPGWERLTVTWVGTVDRDLGLTFTWVGMVDRDPGLGMVERDLEWGVWYLTWSRTDVPAEMRICMGCCCQPIVSEVQVCPRPRSEVCHYQGLEMELLSEEVGLKLGELSLVVTGATGRDACGPILCRGPILHCKKV